MYFYTRGLTGAVSVFIFLLLGSNMALSVQAARLSRRGMNAAMQKTASSFKWAVRRIGPVTTSLVLYLETIGKENGAKQGTSARHLRAFDHAQLKQLKVLDARTYFCDLKPSAERANFLTAWLTKHTPCFRVLRMQSCNPELILDIFPLQQRKNLDLELCLCDIELSQTVRCLPQLQTLQLCAAPVGLYVTELDVSQCRHFKALLLSHVGVGRLLKPPTCIVFRLAHFLTYLSATGLVN
jgi:hypothetical protein